MLEKGTFNTSLNATRGLGIVLVVMGHGILPNHSIIDSFHVPLFFLLSGLYDKKQHQNKGKQCEKLFIRLVIPYFSFKLIGELLLIFNCIVYDGNVFGPLWFLEVLVFIKFGSVFMKRLELALVAVLLSYYLESSILLASYLFYLIGAVYFKYVLLRVHLLVHIVLFVVSNLLLYTELGDNVSFYGERYLLSPFWYILAALSGSVLAVNLSKYIMFQSQVLVNLLLRFSHLSLPLMLIHFPLVQTSNYLIGRGFFGDSTMILALIAHLLILVISLTLAIVAEKWVPFMIGYGYKNT